MSYIRVLNKRIPLDNSYENVITFKDLYNASGTKIQTHMTKDAYFKSYDSYYGNIEYYQKVNFRYGDTLKTSCKLTDVSISSNVLTGLNYAHVINNDNPRYPSNLYYFITDILYLSGSVIQLELELDIFTTYFDYTGFKNDGVIFTKRCHCDRFNNYGGVFGNEEALLPDVIDGQYNATILKTHESIFSQYKYIVLYLANNTPRIKYDGSGTTYTITHKSGKKVYAWSGGLWELDSFATQINGYPAPYIMAVIPIDSSLVKGTGVNFDSLPYGINQMYPDDSGANFYSCYAKSSYVLAMQFTNFDFSSYLTLNDGDYLCDVSEHSSSDVEFVAPAVMIKSLTSKTMTRSFNNIYLYGRIGLGADFSKDTMQQTTKRLMYLEPKLYTEPYTRYTYTSASDKEYSFMPMLVGKYKVNCDFMRVFTPNPTSNGEMTFITSTPYEYYKSNYMGSSPVQNNELPVSNSNLQVFMENQKNSYFTGVGMSMVNAMFSVGSGVTTGNPTQAVAGAIGGVGELLSLGSKMKDLTSQPNKLGGTNFDFYSIMSCTDTNKYVNCWTLIDKELKKVTDFYYMTGYEVDMFRSCNMKSNYMTCAKDSIVTRKLFDFVQLDENIVNQLYYDKNDETPLSQVIRDKFNAVFSQGVRLWFLTSNTQFRDFTLENKEIN